MCKSVACQTCLFSLNLQAKTNKSILIYVTTACVVKHSSLYQKMDPVHDPAKHKLEWRLFRMDTIPNGHNFEWTQSQMDTISNGHNPERTLSQMDEIPNAHDLE